jgi:hypothetical protein
MPFVPLPTASSGASGGINTDFVTHMQLFADGRVGFHFQQSTKHCMTATMSLEEQKKFVRMIPNNFVYSPSRECLFNRNLLSHYMKGVYTLDTEKLHLTFYFANDLGTCCIETCAKAQFPAFERSLGITQAQSSTPVASSSTKHSKRRRIENESSSKTKSS